MGGVSRVLVTGGADGLGAAVVRRLLRDPAFEVRVSDPRPTPVWMREGAAIHSGDLRSLNEARSALRGCSHVIHTAAPGGPFTSLETDAAILRAALDAGVERFTFAADPVGEALCRAARAEHGLPFTICRVHGAYGPGVDEPCVRGLLRAASVGDPLAADGDGVVALTYTDDAADGLVLATAASAAEGETFDVAASVPLRAVAEACWSACGRPAAELVLTRAPDRLDAVPSAAALERVTGWRAATAPADGIARTLASLDHLSGGH